MTQVPGTSVITFREDVEGITTVIHRDVSAAVRFTDLASHQVVLDHVGEDSPLAPLVFWDIAHALPVGGKVAVIGGADLLLRRYFQEAFEVEVADEGVTVLRKVTICPAEQDRGLSDWTFGIPVGPGDATVLNIVVARILELPAPQKEIILCGRPGANFEFWDKVKIVGEDIAAPPIKIAAKKNAIVSAARFGNLCILHDRVVLPLNFLRAMERFGDCFALSTLQSLYFDDMWNMVPRRYSDVGTMKREENSLPVGIKPRAPTLELSSHSQDLLEAAEQYEYIAANVHRYKDGAVYPTGSLYVCKRSVWNACPLDDGYHWAELEDVEHGRRAAAAGIPTQVNAYTLTQSILARPLLNFHGGSAIETLDGRARFVRMMWQFLPVPRKPLFRVSAEEAAASFRKFATKYAVPERWSFSSRTTIFQYMKAYIYAVRAASFTRRENEARSFYNEVIQWLGFEQVVHSLSSQFVRRAREVGARAKETIVSDSDYLISLAGQRAFGGPLFVTDPTMVVPPRSPLQRIGTILSAFALSRQNGRSLFLHGGLRAYYEAITASTPVPRRQ